MSYVDLNLCTLDLIDAVNNNEVDKIDELSSRFLEVYDVLKDADTDTDMGKVLVESLKTLQGMNEAYYKMITGKLHDVLEINSFDIFHSQVNMAFMNGDRETLKNILDTELSNISIVISEPRFLEKASLLIKIAVYIPDYEALSKVREALNEHKMDTD